MICWIKSYLSGRSQTVVMGEGIKKVFSKEARVTVGVPQGSVMGPILFVIYLNDITELNSHISDNQIVNYADDTSFLLKANNLPCAIHQAQLLLEKANEYFTKNKLLLNNAKTKIVFFKTNRSRIQEPDTINLNNSEQRFESSAKFLGMCLDNMLSWEGHIEQLVVKLSRINYTLRILSKYTDFQTMKMLYHANFESNVRYGIMFYGSCKDISKVFVCQKRALRSILGLAPRTSCKTKFKKNVLLTVSAVYIQECVLFFYKNRSLFISNAPQIFYATRTLNYNFPKHRLTMYENGAYYNCIKFYNCLPNFIKEADNIRVLKRLLHEYLVNIEPYNINDFLSHTI